MLPDLIDLDRIPLIYLYNATLYILYHEYLVAKTLSWLSTQVVHHIGVLGQYPDTETWRQRWVVAKIGSAEDMELEVKIGDAFR